MKIHIKCLLILVLTFLNASFGFLIKRYHKPDCNNRPIIGILTQEVTGKLIDYYGMHSCYLAASYVKHMESAGARVVPIWIGKEKDYYRSILSLINGVLLPGGASEFNVTKGYAEAGKYIMEIADELNEQGDFFPIWGTCLGFELMAFLANNGQEIRVDCKSNDQALPLEFRGDFLDSKLFGDTPDEILKILSRENSTINYHQYCVTCKDMEMARILDEWRVLSVNCDEKGLEFISSMEHKGKPYFAVQFHPEKPAYEWKPNSAVPHDANSIKANQYFADFFVAQARKNFHSFASIAEERKYLIYNYPVTCGAAESSFTQVYFFD